MSDSKPAICLMTPDFVGPTRNGGIGTAFYHLARFLRDEGYVVHVLYCLRDWTDDEADSLTDWQARYKKEGIALHRLPETPKAIAATDSSPHVNISLEAALALEKLHKEHRFAAVHVPEWGGFGYVSLRAKEMGQAFAGLPFFVQTHSPTFWHREYNRDPLSHIGLLHIHFMEKESVRLADRLISPSRYMLEWLKERKEWTLPEKREVIPNLIGVNSAPKKPRKDKNTNELVFFGRLEYRKGLVLFCEAVKALDAKRLKETGITFLGKESVVQGAPSLAYIRQAFKGSGVNWRHEGGLNTREAQEYLRGEGRLAVIASLQENLPYTVYECALNAIPFIAADTGGVAELLKDNSALFPPTVPALTKKLHQALKEGVTPASLALSPEDVQEQWRALHKGLHPVVPAEKGMEPEPLLRDSPLTGGGGAIDGRLLGGAQQKRLSAENFAEHYPDIGYLLPYALGLASYRDEVRAALNRLKPFKKQTLDDNLLSHIGWLEHEFDYYARALKKETKEKERLCGEIERLKRDCQRLEKEKATAEDCIKAMENSTSWRITAPLRKAMTGLRKK